MSKYKYEFISFTPKDYRTFERHFQEMANKGLFVESINRSSIKYRKDEPMNLVYSFDFNETAHSLDGKKSKVVKEYIDFIEESGWKHVFTTGKINLFYHSNPYAKSLHSDNLMLYRSMDYDKSTSKKVIFITPLLNVFLYIFILFFNWKRLLVSNEMLLFILGFIIFQIIKTIYSFREYKYANYVKECLKREELPEERTIKTLKINSFLSQFNLIFILLLFNITESIPGMAIILVTTILLLFIANYINNNAHSYVFNGMMVIGILCVMLLSMGYAIKYEEDVVNNPKRFIPTQNHRIIDYEYSSSIFVKRFDELFLEDQHAIDWGRNSIRIEYFDGRYDFVTDLLFEDLKDTYDISEKDKVIDSRFDERYHTYSLNQGNYYIKFDITLIRDGNRFIYIHCDDPSLFDIEKIIDDCISLN